MQIRVGAVREFPLGKIKANQNQAPRNKEHDCPPLHSRRCARKIPRVAAPRHSMPIRSIPTKNISMSSNTSAVAEIHEPRYNGEKPLKTLIPQARSKERRTYPASHTGIKSAAPPANASRADTSRGHPVVLRPSGRFQIVLHVFEAVQKITCENTKLREYEKPVGEINCHKRPKTTMRRTSSRHRESTHLSLLEGQPHSSGEKLGAATLS